jgi:uncharacterized protein (TIGR03066 family)
MTMRFILFPAILLIALVTGCAVPTDAPERAAPEPQAEKTKAELIVGTWKLVKRTPPNTRGSQKTYEQTKDGKVILWTDNPQDGQRIFGGTYRVEGDTLFRNLNTEVGEFSATIESITVDPLVTSSTDAGERRVYKYERVSGK